MSTAVQILQIIFYSIGSLFMIAFMIIGIWSFVIFTKMFNNQRIQTYLLEKINNTISSLKLSTQKDTSKTTQNEIDSDLLVQDSFFKDSADDSDQNNDNIFKIK